MTERELVPSRLRETRPPLGRTTRE
ncbi:hypothetical protein RB2654_13920 [Rhodobacterales bacterium HTCC2654]|uniref:Uncharacterized protein n=1 Tax=Maritimibacter alkaliphilus HTCC2654 TaxID=314271 RepID=A3VGI3_9RHOB|nr:hypothetical protein RB2654_13920 [Rhodobacterales bacterium HTCC2654] [Maritimibacter alkaliphilus HTCC2654]